MKSTILAYDMNGAALTVEHGYPLRAIVPDERKVVDRDRSC
ncbi:MAG TPA: molybdopterin-dependent oxidoreductase [Nitrososphaeraceae archaeon]|nr:molybdopterin-dependent oxidoreductase [Nitrososphaeraceae archaeon]